MHSLALYIHIPYCLEKCPYCDFHSIAVERPSIPQEAYAHCLVRQLSQDVVRLNLQKSSLLSIFFGGGTPSLMSPHFFETVLGEISQKLALQKDVEITVETNPATATQVDFRKWRALGINRISFGVQSFQKEMLQKLGRHHSPQEAEDAVKMAQEAGFENVSCDLIFGIEGQTQKMLEKDLEKVLSLNIPHISAYQLTVEKGTPLASWVESGQFQIPEEENLVAMHHQVSETLEKGGWHRYEISNYSKSGFESRHNLQYWRYRDFLGIGSGAYSFVQRKRWRTARKLKDYLAQNSIYEEEEAIDDKTAWKEKWMMGLRISEGVTPTLEESQRWETHFSKWAKEGWIRPVQERIQLTTKGLLFCNQMVQNVFDMIDEV